MAYKESAKNIVPANFGVFLDDVKNRIQTAQTRAALSVNAELVRLYRDIGRIIAKRQSKEGRDSAVIPRLTLELHKELADIKGFSERNIDHIITFFRAYQEPSYFSPLAVEKSLARIMQEPLAQFPDSLTWSVPWAHHVIISRGNPGTERKAENYDH